MNIQKQDLVSKIKNRQRISTQEALLLYDFPLHELGQYANSIREERFSKKTYFNFNRHINPTNICKDVCKFCAYSATRKNPTQYTMSHEDILQAAKQAYENGATEVHIVSAHNNQVPLQWYLDIFQQIRRSIPELHIKALTAAEVHFLSTEHNKTHQEIIELMIENGVDSMPGGGAEIFNRQVRDYICKGKVNTKEWLEIHKLWHQQKRQSNATMLFGHIETREHRIDHIDRLRTLQDETGGFNAFIPLVYQKQNNYLKVKKYPQATEILKTFAISRIFLDNIANLKAYWATTTLKLALLAQEYGANDIDGTLQKESIQSAAGANSRGGVKADDLIHSIKNCGFIPVERDSLYNELKTW